MAIRSFSVTLSGSANKSGSALLCDISVRPNLESGGVVTICTLSSPWTGATHRSISFGTAGRQALPTLAQLSKTLPPAWLAMLQPIWPSLGEFAAALASELHQQRLKG